MDRSETVVTDAAEPLLHVVEESVTGGVRSWRFGIADMMIASAAVALSLRFTVTEQRSLAETASQTVQGLARSALPSILLVLIGVLMAVPPGLLLIQLRARRMTWNKLLLQPGFIACAAATCGVVEAMFLSDHRYQFAQAIIPAWIAVVWAGLAATGRWRATGSILERLGRIIGMLWLGIGALLLLGLMGVRGW